jgi:glycine oxidase
VAGAICRDLMDGTADPRWETFKPGRFSGRETSAASANIMETA